jgi:hypothetical protein
MKLLRNDVLGVPIEDAIEAKLAIMTIGAEADGRRLEGIVLTPLPVSAYSEVKLGRHA